jgi:hypothetical protein
MRCHVNTEDGTLYRSHHAARWSCPDAGAISASQDVAQDNRHDRHHALQCPIVYFLQ